MSSKNTIKIVTLGCPKNIVDSEVLAKQLLANKFKVDFNVNEEQSDIVIINSCGFINDAKQESIDTILSYLEAKKQGKFKKVFVAGCLSQRYKDDLIRVLPDVDGFFGTEAYAEILEKLNSKFNYELLSERALITPSHYAYLKISEGCNQKCSFCSIPLIRGPYVSKPIEAVVKEAEYLAAKGVKELIVIAENSTYYGTDIYNEQKIAELLEKLSEVDGIEWIRLQYAYPSGFPLNLLKVINDNPKVCRYLDIPFQHISDVILKSMKRGITKSSTLKLIDTIRKEVPGIALRTSIITGYPLETDEMFKELMEFVNNVRFERLGVFTYSHEENTASYKLKDRIPQNEKQQRADIIMKLQQKISLELNKTMVSSTTKILIDRKEGDHYIGRTESDSPEIDNEVIISSKNQKTKIDIGKFYDVRITSAKPYDLTGNII